jgi:hypothetical protein
MEGLSVITSGLLVPVSQFSAARTGCPIKRLRGGGE